ncbi:unnamed protein product [Schistosoma margrebowiei]|uniref:Uncharacterized protein n=1 Tax=Schistosoma margrebowiei TaxID=48269 RepID=A0A183MT63_9TREM|nr:unnamed protein product [Schistosoma margrebowiei]
MIYQDIKNFTTLLHHPNPVRTQGYADNSLRICDFGVSKDHLSLSTTSKSGIESYNSPELSETLNLCELTVSNQPTYLISNVIVPNIIYPNDSHISDEISYKSEENMLNEPIHDRKPDVVLTDIPLLCNDILNKFEETISKESNCDVISNIICPHNAFVAFGKLVQCEA